MPIHEHDPFREDAQFRILRVLQANPEVSQRDLARAVGVSNGFVHFALRALVEKGFVKLERFSRAPDKRRFAYVLTPAGAARKLALAGRFLQRKRRESDGLRAEIAALEAELAADTGPAVALGQGGAVGATPAS